MSLSPTEIIGGRGGGLMCTGVADHKADGSVAECDTQGQLAAELGGESFLVFLNIAGAYEPDVCLCPVDTKATAERAGYVFYPVCSYISDGEPDVFNEHFVRASFGGDR